MQEKCQNPPYRIVNTTLEWIELYNQNNFEVDLSGWKIEDILGKTTIYTISAGTKISSEGFLAFLRPATKITLNNKEDGLNLIQPNGNVIDKVIYEKAPIGESYNRVKRYFKVLPEAGSYNRGLEEWFWSNDLTPGKENTPSEKEETANHLEVELRGTQTAAIGEKIPKSNYLSTFLIAFSVAVFSGIVILILKRTLKASSGQ